MLNIEHLSYVSDEQEFELSLQGNLTERVFSGTLAAKRLSVPPFGQASANAQDTTILAQTETVSAPAKLLGDQAIGLNWLHQAQLELAVQADVLVLGSAQFDSFASVIDLRDGVLGTRVQGRVDQSPVDAQLDVSAVENGSVDVRMQLNLQGVSLEQLGFLPQDQLTGGDLTVQLSLDSSGASPAALGANLTGNGVVMIEDAQLANDYVETVGSDVVMELVNKLNPFHKADPTTQLNCAIAQFDADNGKVDFGDRLAFETSKMKILADGHIDLNDESINITFTPSAQQGVGINVGNLVKFVKLGGTLIEPVPEIDALGTLQSGLAVGAAISTGGASILAEGLIKRAISAGSACDTWHQASLSVD